MKVLSILFLLFSMTVQAAQWAQCLSENTVVYDAPAGMQKDLRKLKKGSMVQASNQPTQGHYKVRLSDGMLGWIKGEDLMLKGTPQILE